MTAVHAPGIARADFPGLSRTFVRVSHLDPADEYVEVVTASPVMATSAFLDARRLRALGRRPARARCPHRPHYRGRPHGRDRSLTMAIGTAPDPAPDKTGDAYVKFRGMQSTDGSPDVALGDHMEFSGVAECVQIGTEKRADGEQRPVIGMRVMEVELGPVSKAPKDDQLPFDADAEAEL